MHATRRIGSMAVRVRARVDRPDGVWHRPIAVARCHGIAARDRPLRGRRPLVRLPGTWGDASFDVESSFSHVLVFLSTAPLSDPCDRTASSFACVRNPVTALEPDGVLVEWSRQSFPGWTFDPTKGRLTTVGGRQATLEQSVPLEGPCQEIGGERELVVTIVDPTPDMNWTGMRACLRGPSLDDLQAQVEAMLASVTWSE